MDVNQNIVEYYDELYPVTEAQKEFYLKESAIYGKPVRYLRIGCGTGSFEHYLAKEGADVTGIESSSEMIASANRRRRTQLMAIRFFQMSSLEMTRFLGKGFYNLISILDDRIIYTHDYTLLAKLFYDCKQLISKKGKLVISLPNFEKYNQRPKQLLPVRESIRSKLFTQIVTKDDDSTVLNQDLETGNGKIIPVTRDVSIYPVTRSDVKELAKKAGFTKIEFFSNFYRDDFTSDSDNLICVIS